MMIPSQTPHGQAWLRNFAEQDRDVATLLIDALRVVSFSKLWAGLDEQLRTLIERRQISPPALVIPERSLKHFGIHGEDRVRAVAYEDFEPGADLEVSKLGSDGFVSLLLRELRVRSAGAPEEWLRPSAKLCELRDARCRSIVVVTDYLGTGSQVLALTSALTRNRTIRSWRSRGLRIYVAGFAASQDAVIRVRQHRSVDDAWPVEIAPTIMDAPWNPDARAAVVALCEQECRVPLDRALGFSGTGGLFLTERSAPNNLPAVLTQNTTGWVPLFPDRTVPVEFARLVGEYRPTESLSDLANRLGQIRLGRNDRVKDMRGASRLAIAVLALANAAPCTDLSIAGELSLDQMRARRLLQSLCHWGFVDSEGAITEAGRRELAAHKRGRRRTTAFAQGDDSVYYPFNLR